MREKIIIAAGGTGGHLYPAMRIAESLSDYDILFMGGGLNTSKYFDREKHAFLSIEASPWKGFSLKSLWDLTKGNLTGLFQARKAIKSFNPLAILGFGSFHTLPIMAAAKLCRTPLFQYEANSVPGKVVKLFSSYAAVTAVQFPYAQRAIKGSSKLISMGGKFTSIDKLSLRGEAYSYFNLSPQAKTILITGGSQGAEAINACVAESFCSRLMEGWQIIHLVGAASSIEKYSEAYAKANVSACVKHFEPRMDLALSAADFFMGRSGAGTVAELLQTHTPAILIPYPYATENHQKHNADFFVDTVGGGSLILQNELTPQKLYTAFLEGKKQLEPWENAIKNYTAHIKLPSLETAAREFLKSLQK
ncbi:MAG: UDP-N-acetylglucosamine--N-acetylmuramyl-(pentapeptide) pyrophosphoryl-undecaprenol N-acetylglucosamine transferase [Parachlamydiales bacterium]|jgi:UDP-N-acetylglucosamine--N-acetylmuramyl-(pentapeptide) pyrophosphoryl-undecaprenol N-acetylglucosamine transferase